MTAEITIFAYPGACSRVTISALEEIGTEFDVRWIDISNKKQYDSDYLSLNRKAKVPTLIVDGTPLTENAAILNYLHLAYPDAQILPASSSVFESARYVSDLAWCSGMLHPMVRQIRNPQKWTHGAELEGIRNDGIEKLSKECSFINDRLSKSEWWYGADWSILDVYIYWVYSTAAKGEFSLSEFPALAEHAKKVRARPSFERTLAREIAAIEREGLKVNAATL
ncbi:MULTISPECIES: glutathione S-transferase family protein [Hyphomicrobiales]|uniref:glutathione S-transferase family protein n=1 Tax=Hyphomicrobiales TaxID=356 RepID=UPI00320BEA79|nr:glutathione S-transferase family protein [Oricola sp.]